ncbi:MAG: hypothetical protein JWO38_1656 [Gemmataceae bacterium]|nr:hypothetical protein [Gemmataceae bacterium]
MKRTVILRLAVVTLAVALAVGGLLWLGGWPGRWANDPSVILKGERSWFSKVENGSAYDQALVELGTSMKVVLPLGTEVRRTAGEGKVQLFMRKTLGFGGHPPESMSIRGARKNMGCAVRVEDGAVVIGTFGEWDSWVEGGAYLRLIAVVPKGVEVELRRGLAGPRSRAGNGGKQPANLPPPRGEGYWYGPVSPADGWTAIPDAPDRDCTAKGLGALPDGPDYAAPTYLK